MVAAALSLAAPAQAQAQAAVYSGAACEDPTPVPGYTVLTLAYTGAEETVDIPAGVTQVRIDACGAEGGSVGRADGAAGGQGGQAGVTLALSGPTTLAVLVGEAGQSQGAPRSFGGGGSYYEQIAPVGGGGSFVRDAADRLLVAAGGGGGASACHAAGGAGGGAEGVSGVLQTDETQQYCGYPAPPAGTAGGGGGTQTSGGAGGGRSPYGPGSDGTSYQGGDGDAVGGGGGGGYYGGGGGALQAGAGGGSGFVTDATGAADPVSTQGGKTGAGAVRIAYDLSTPTLSTHATPSATAGGAVSDSALVTGLYSPAGEGPPPAPGTITFRAFGPDDPSCSAADPPFTSVPVDVTRDGAYESGSFMPALAGTYRWRASYSGDADNAPVAGACDAADETTVVTYPLSVITTATPTSKPAPGGTFRFGVVVTNNTHTDLTITSLSDDVYGDVSTQGTCTDAVDRVLPADGGSYSCAFDGVFTGSDGATQTDAVTAKAVDAVGDEFVRTDDATVTLTAAPVVVDLRATPLSRPAPGGSFAFDVDVTNTSSQPVTITDLTDDTYGDISKQGSCTDAVGTVLDPDGGAYSCAFTGQFSGVSGDSQTDVVRAAVVDEDATLGSDTDDATVTLTASPSTGGTNLLPYTPEAPQSASPSPSTSPSTDPAASSPSAPAASSNPAPTAPASSGPPTTPPASSTATAARTPLGLTAQTPLVRAGSTSSLVATGAANEPYELRCYTRPSTTYFTARRGSFGATGGPVSFTLSLGRNTRCFLQYATDPARGASASVVVDVSTVLSLSSLRTGTRTYVFQGRTLPRAAGQLITLYRLDGDGNEVRTSNLITDDTGDYRVTRRFTGRGTFRFRVRTTRTMDNAAGSSADIILGVH